MFLWVVDDKANFARRAVEAREMKRFILVP
jgi:hypothetical protein